MQAIGIDVGGSGIKGAIVDTSTGELVSERLRLASPEGFGRDDVLDTIAAVVHDLHAPADLPLGVGFPSQVSGGVTRTDPTSHEHPGWKGTEVAAPVAERTLRRTVVGNDADVAGLAEVVFGAAGGRDGVVLVLTLGTGIGSALIHDGVIVPNIELGRIFLQGEDLVAEYQAASRIRTEEGLSWKQYARRLDRYLDQIDRVFAPDLVIVGGGIVKKHEKWLPRLTVGCEIVPATLGNNAGIVGAALSAARHSE
ncbi:MAG: ROK family protein [Actinomycetota bacterium]